MIPLMLEACVQRCDAGYFPVLDLFTCTARTFRHAWRRHFAFSGVPSAHAFAIMAWTFPLIPIHSRPYSKCIARLHLP